MTLIMSERYGPLKVEVRAAATLEASYHVLFYAHDVIGRRLVWQEAFTESITPYVRGIEIAMTGFLLRAKTGVCVTGQPEPASYEALLKDVAEMVAKPEFFQRFNACELVSSAVFHQGRVYKSSSTFDLIGNPVRLDIETTVIGDGVTDNPTHHLTFTVAVPETLATREGYQPTRIKRSCTFVVRREQLRFDDEEFVREYQKEIITALGLEGEPS